MQHVTPIGVVPARVRLVGKTDGQRSFCRAILNNKRCIGAFSDPLVDPLPPLVSAPPQDLDQASCGTMDPIVFCPMKLLCKKQIRSEITIQQTS